MYLSVMVLSLSRRKWGDKKDIEEYFIDAKKTAYLKPAGLDKR